MTGENGSPVTPDWQPTAREWDDITAKSLRHLDAFEAELFDPENIVRGTN